MPSERPARTERAERRPRVAVVLCTWRGERHLGEQLDSLAAQSWPVSVTVHDDAGGDACVSVAGGHPGVDAVVAHPDNVGYVANFERGIAHALASGQDYIALSDQDDVWHPDRVARGMATMLRTERAAPAGQPVLVHSDLSIVDASGTPLHASFLARRRYGIGDEADLALVLGQNGVMGNTVLMNRALASLALPFPPGLHVHDWWLALVAELYGRRRLERRPGVAYRSHADNASNPAGSIEPGTLAILSRLSWRRLAGRDFRVPFREDSRARVLASLLAGDGHRPVPRGTARTLVEDFLVYVGPDGTRVQRLVAVLRHGFLRRGLRHRARVVLAVLFTARYDAP